MPTWQCGHTIGFSPLSFSFPCPSPGVTLLSVENPTFFNLFTSGRESNLLQLIYELNHIDVLTYNNNLIWSRHGCSAGIQQPHRLQPLLLCGVFHAQAQIAEGLNVRMVIQALESELPKMYKAYVWENFKNLTFFEPVLV